MSKNISEQDRKFLTQIKDKFVTVAGEDKFIDKNELQEALGIKDSHYAARIFSVIDHDKSGEVNLEEFLSFIEDLVHGDEDSKLTFAFKLYDTDGNDSIEEAELGQIISASLNESGLEIDSELQKKLTHTMFAKVDADESGRISLREYKGLLDQYPELKKRMTVSAAKWLTPEPIQVEKNKTITEKIQREVLS